MGRNMLGQDSMVPNMMGRNVYSIMSNRGMASDMSNTLRQQMVSNTMGHDMTMDVMGRNRIDQARNSQMMGGNIMMGRQDMTPNMMYNNIMGQGMMDMTNSQMSSNMVSGRGMMDSRSNNGLMGQRMMQKMEIERVPETYMSTRFY